MSKIIYFVLALAPFIISAIYYNNFSDQVAVHWDNLGTPDKFVSKFFAAWIIPAIMLGLVILVNIFNKYDPRKATNKNETIRSIGIWLAVSIPVIVQFIIVIQADTDSHFNLMSAIILVIGLLIIIFGNYLPKTRSNFFLGYRLPWTLSEEDNWKATHRLAGFVWIITGITISITAFFSHYTSIYIIHLACIAVMFIVPTVFSLIKYKHIKKDSNDIKPQ